MAGGSVETSDDDGTVVPVDESLVNSLRRVGREEGLGGLFAGVSPRIGKALISGAIQFATYEETKRSIRNSFQKVGS